MEAQRTTTEGNAKTGQIRAPKESAESERQPVPFFESSPHSSVASGVSNPGLPPTQQQQLLFWQRTIGNRAVVQSLGPALELKQTVNKDDKDSAASSVVAEVPGAEKEEVREESPNSSQPNSMPDEEQKIPLVSGVESKTHWGQLTNINADRLAWKTPATASLNSIKPPSWSGASAGIASPKPVSWAAIESMSKAAGKDGAMTSGPPVGADILTIQGHSGNIWGLAWTYFPKGYKAPDFDFNSADKAAIGSPKWYASPKSTVTAFEGTGDAYYPPAGLHKTAHIEAGKNVYWNLSGPISALNKAAEQEHCDDHAYAYKISLKEAQTVLTKHIYGKDFGPKGTQAEAEKLVLDTIKGKLTHPKLGSDKTTWAATYDTLFRKTLARDASWHSFAKGKRSTNAAGDVIYQIDKGTTKIGVVKSKTIIKY